MNRRAAAIGSAVLGVLTCSPWVCASQLHVTVRAAGGSFVTAVAGGKLRYAVVGELNDMANEGLAYVVFDLSFTGGNLAQADEPVDLPMMNFDRDLGITNPAGFGGTLLGGALLQVGGAQNVIKNTAATATFPVGSVLTGVAWPGSPVELAAGWLDVPAVAGQYVLSASNLSATVIRQGEDGSGAVWGVESAGAGTIVDLTVDVIDVPPGAPSVLGVGARYLEINAGSGVDPVAFRLTPDCPEAPTLFLGVPAGPLNVAPLVSDPMDAFFLTPAQWGGLVYVTGADIVPSQAYLLEADVGELGKPNLYPATAGVTRDWGELNGTSTVDVDDILCSLAAFSETGGCSLFAADLMGVVPSQVVDVDDILAVLQAFSGAGYPGPTPCE